MHHEQILARILESVPENALSAEQVGALRSAVIAAIGFLPMIAHLPSAGSVTQNPDLVTRQIMQGLQVLYQAKSVVSDCMSSLKNDPYELTGYANESTVDNAEVLVDLRKLASDIAQDTPAVPLTWQTYSCLGDLRKEYQEHLSVLDAEDESVEQRLRALLNTIRLQFVFLANTYY